MNDMTRLIDRHLASYGEPDKARRAEAVADLWTQDGQLIDPPMAARGHAQIVDQAEALLGQFPGHRFKRSTGIDTHHGCARYGWQLVDPEGRAVLEGCDFAEVDGSHRLARVTGFFGPLPAREVTSAA